VDLEFYEKNHLDTIPFSKLLEIVQSTFPDYDLKLLKLAYDKAVQLHEHQLRLNGEPFANHVIKVAMLAAEFKLDFTSVCASLLHDTLEDTNYSLSDLKTDFGEEIAYLVEGVTKLSKLNFSSKQEQQAENFRKLLLATVQDIRVILIKLCDRLHNIMTIGALPELKRKSIAEETLEIYAALANRLGLNRLKNLLEDYSFKELKPAEYNEISEKVRSFAADIMVFAKDTCEEIRRTLEENGLTAQVSYRLKHLYGIYQKMVKYSCSFEQVMDILGFRIIVPSIKACYEALGVIHSHFQLVPGRIKDFIAMPKPNFYQSLHTTVLTSSGQRVEIQIRTPEMHQIAEQGVAAHWKYKDKMQFDFDLSWVRDLVESQKYITNPEEFIQSVKGELFQDEIYVFSPKGDLFKLPRGSCPIDFAYAVHTEIGHQTVGARVNGTMVPLNTKLRSGDTIEIITQKAHKPSKDWLKFVVTSKAKNRIKQFLRNEKRETSIKSGRELLSKELTKCGESLKKIEKSTEFQNLLQELKLQSPEELYSSIFYNKVSLQKVLAKLIPKKVKQEQDQQTILDKIFSSAAKKSKTNSIITVNGHSDVYIRLAKCCQPLPGDPIIGYVTKGRGLTVHSVTCPEISLLDPLRFISVDWGTDQETLGTRSVTLVIDCKNEVGLLAKLTTQITSLGFNINSAIARTFPSNGARIYFEIEVRNSKDLNILKTALQKVAGVTKVERVLGKPTEN